MQILSFWGRSLIILLKINKLVFWPQLNAEIWNKLFNLLLTSTLISLWRIAHIKIDVYNRVPHVETIVMHGKHWGVFEIRTNNTEFLPGFKSFYINFVFSKVLLGAPFNRNSASWRIKSYIEIKNLLFKIYINIFVYICDILVDI